jgi:hypothetical protein
MDAVLARLMSTTNAAIFNALVAEYQSNETRMSFRRGRAKVQDAFPVICVEMMSRAEPWGATSHTKDIKIDLNIYAMIRILGGNTGDRIAQKVEDYIVELGETLQAILNERGQLQYKDIDGNGMCIYDSYAETASYETVYNGAVRQVKMPWFGKLWLFSGSPTVPGGGFST